MTVLTCDSGAKADWDRNWARELVILKPQTICTAIAGLPHLELNGLYSRPISSASQSDNGCNNLVVLKHDIDNYRCVTGNLSCWLMVALKGTPG